MMTMMMMTYFILVKPTPREKLSHSEIYASGSERHHRCPVYVLCREKLHPANLMLLLCVRARSVSDS